MNHRRRRLCPAHTMIAGIAHLGRPAGIILSSLSLVCRATQAGVRGRGEGQLWRAQSKRSRPTGTASASDAINVSCPANVSRCQVC